MTNRIKQATTGHFISHWGVPNDIFPKTARFGEIAILEFAPRKERNTWRYATNGMAAYLQNRIENRLDVRTELFGCSRDRNSWVPELLLALANYPSDYHTYFTEGDTIEVGRAVDQHSSKYSGILLASPEPFDQETLGIIGEGGETILVHQAVGLYEGEIAIAQERGGKALWETICRKGQRLLDVSE